MSERIGKYLFEELDGILNIHYVHSSRDLRLPILLTILSVVCLLFGFGGLYGILTKEIKLFTLIVTIIGLGLSFWFGYLIYASFWKPKFGVVSFDKKNGLVTIRDVLRSSKIPIKDVYEISSSLEIIKTPGTPIWTDTESILYLQMKNKDRIELLLVRLDKVGIGSDIEKSLNILSKQIRKKIYNYLEFRN